MIMPRRRLKRKGKVSGKSYSGVLLQNILLPDRTSANRKLFRIGLRPTSAQRADERIIQSERVAKLPALFEHFGIDPKTRGAWQALACALAVKHVPGFQVRHATGAPAKVHLDTLCRLYRFAIVKNAARKNRARKLSDTSISGLPELKRQIQELQDCRPKRLRNLLSEARQMRKARVKWLVETCRLRKTFGDDEDELSELDFIRGDPPLWSYEKNLRSK
jgi:hypothetical protein